MCLYAILSLKINRACTELDFHDSETFFNFPSLLVYTNDFFRPGCLQISTNGVDHFGFLISFIFPFFNKLISTLSAEAIILYSMLLKRTGMSFKNNWIDKEGSEAVGIQTFVTPKGRSYLLLLIEGEKTRGR